MSDIHILFSQREPRWRGAVLERMYGSRLDNIGDNISVRVDDISAHSDVDVVTTSASVDNSFFP